MSRDVRLFGQGSTSYAWEELGVGIALAFPVLKGGLTPLDERSPISRHLIDTDMDASATRRDLLE